MKNKLKRLIKKFQKNDVMGMSIMPLYFSSIILFLFFVYLVVFFSDIFDKLGNIFSTLMFAIIFIMLFVFNINVALIRKQYPQLYYLYLVFVLFIGVFLIIATLKMFSN